MSGELSKEEKRALAKKALKEFFTWDEHYERGALLGLIVGFLYITITGQADSALAAVHAFGVVPYGLLWVWMNPFYWTSLPYNLVIFSEVAVTFTFYWWLVRRGILPKVIVELCFFSIVFLAFLHAQQNITTIMLAPLVSITPLVLIPMVFQRLPLGWSWNLSDVHWACAFYGNGNGLNTLVNPCLAVSTHLNLTHAYSVVYLVTAIWAVVPLLYWYRNHWRGKWYGVTQYEFNGYFYREEKPFQDAMIGTTMREWFCSLCGEWKTCEWFRRGDLIIDGWEEFGFNMKNGFWFDDEWFCWDCVTRKNEVVEAATTVVEKSRKNFGLTIAFIAIALVVVTVVAILLGAPIAW